MGGVMLSEDFKKEVEKLQEHFQANVADQTLYNLIEKIVKDDDEIMRWIEED
jgi:acetolactate synthase small subunit